MGVVGSSVRMGGRRGEWWVEEVVGRGWPGWTHAQRWCVGWEQVVADGCVGGWGRRASVGRQGGLNEGQAGWLCGGAAAPSQTGGRCSEGIRVDTFTYQNLLCSSSF